MMQNPSSLTGAAPHSEQHRDDELVALVVRMPEGRVGSTLLMQLLGTSEAVVFDRAYPFEHRYIPWMLELLEPARLSMPFAPMSVDPYDLALRTTRAVWQAFSQAALAREPEARFYAEKLLLSTDPAPLARAGVQVRTIELVRDPRDVLVSIRKFDAKRGFYGFGRTSGQSEADYFAAFVAGMRERLGALGRGSEGDADRILMRYEDMVTDLHASAARLGDWLGLSLDASQVQRQQETFRAHMTSETAQSSLGRWRTELSPLDAREMTEALAEELDRLGYDT